MDAFDEKANEVRKKTRGRKKLPEFVGDFNLLSKGERLTTNVPLEYYYICENYGLPKVVPIDISTRDAALLIGVCKVTLIKMIKNNIIEAKNKSAIPGRYRFRPMTLSVLKYIHDVNAPIKDLQIMR